MKIQHILLTGRTGETGAHDFIDVLGDLNLLTRAQAVGYAMHRFGVVMLSSFVAIGGVTLGLKRLKAEEGVTVYETPEPGVSTLTLSSTARDLIE